jgi:hypothetical protein
MLPIIRGISGLLCAFALGLPGVAAAQETRAVAGVVVDAESGAPVADVLVTIQGTALRAVTGPDGRFGVGGVPIGNVQLVLRHVAYGEHARPLVVGATGSLDFRIRISSRAIELSPLIVEVMSEDERARRASGNATHVIDRATIDAFAQSGQTLHNILGSRVPSLRVAGSCLEYRLQIFMAPQPESEDELQRLGLACRDITVYVDGIPNREGSAVLTMLSPNDVERLEVLSPGAAGVRYAGSERGVILVETRRGAAAGTDERVNVTGFGWQEPSPYRWLRVLGLSAIGNAAVAGLTFTALDCDPDEHDLVSARCKPAFGMGAGVMTSFLSGMVTRRAGRTPYSEGRVVTGFVIGAATASIGYMLHFHGENQDSDVSRTAGKVVLAVGMPLSLTLSDRVFRVLR